jgi:hypothetical protein
LCSFFTDDRGFNTINNDEEVASSVMTANISDPASMMMASSGNKNNLVSAGQLSPPQPVSTLQHNYSNIQQPIPRSTPPQNHGSLTSSHTQSSNNTSPALTTASASPCGGLMTLLPGENGGGAFSRSAVRPRTPPEERLRRRVKLAADEAKKSKLADLRDLIHLEAPLTEDAVIRTLQARFFNQKYFVSLQNDDFVTHTISQLSSTIPYNLRVSFLSISGETKTEKW